MSYQVEPIPAFSDNYIWLLRRDDVNKAAVVDPGDAAPVLARLHADNLELDTILITHHHGDHVGGIAGLKQAFPNATVFGPGDEGIRGIEYALSEGDDVALEDIGIELEVLAVPGHTRGHIAYRDPTNLFCGDTLFACGCGRVFDGSLQTLADSLQRLADLPSEQLAYCAHEYTLENIGFAKWVEPENPELLQREADTHDLLSSDRPSVPSTIGLELATNPFMRLSEPSVIEAAERWAGKALNGHREVFAALRTWKDREYD